MQEVKRPKRPLIYYYVIVTLLIFLFNALVAPKLAQQAITDVDCGTFMTMTENGEIGKVQIKSNQIIFTNSDDTQIFRTGLIDDPGLVERLHASGAKFTSEIVEQTSPLVSLAEAPALLFWPRPTGRRLWIRR